MQSDKAKETDHCYLRAKIEHAPSVLEVNARISVNTLMEFFGPSKGLKRVSSDKEYVIFQLSCTVSVSKRVLMQNLSYENEFDLHENEHIDRTHIHMNGVALRLVLTERQKTTRK